MSKFGKVIGIIGIVIAVYLIMLIIIPGIVVPLASTANTTMSLTSNMSNYPGASGFLISIPWILWFVPAGIGTAAVIITLRGE